ncbi:MAG: aminoacyl-tRNA hydrolase [Acidimicrobiales bacterium]|nr:aminoacyl-tRNA hydrolase [Acidimicrobiales bacterium]
MVVGLGNPGAEFEGTRHNVGAEAVRRLAARHGGQLRPEKGLQATMASLQLDGRRVLVAVPLTYMNDSGMAVGPLVRRAGVGAHLDEALVVVHDELDLPPGRIRVKAGGGLAGNNGLKSIVAHLHSQDFLRVRIGIGKPPGRQTGTDHVLRRPATSERSLLDVAIEEAADAVEVLVAEGVDVAMNRFNGT